MVYSPRYATIIRTTNSKFILFGGLFSYEKSHIHVVFSALNRLTDAVQATSQMMDALLAYSLSEVDLCF